MIVAPARLLGPPELRRRRNASPRAVDLCLELLDDNEVGMSALRSLADLKSERARAVLEHVADEPTNRGRSDEAQLQRHRVKIARKGLEKLDRAAASGKTRP